MNDDKTVGKKLTVYSPRLEQNIALAIVNINYSNLNQKLIVNDGNNEFNAVIVNKPFYDQIKFNQILKAIGIAKPKITKNNLLNLKNKHANVLSMIGKFASFKRPHDATDK